MDNNHIITNQAEWIYHYNNEHRPQFNDDLFVRDDYEVIEALKRIILSRQRDKYFTIRVDKFTVVEDYEEIHDWNDTFNNLIKEYIDMKGRKDLISFQSDIGIIEESKAIQQLNEIEATLNSQKAVLEVAKQVDETTEYYDSVETPSGYLVVFDNE